MGAVTCCTRPLESTEEPAARISGPGGRTPTSRRAESGWPASAAAAARRVGSNAAACGARLVSRNYHRRTTASGPGPVGSNPVGLRLPAEHRVGWAHPRAQGQGTPTVLQASASRPLQQRCRRHGTRRCGHRKGVQYGQGGGPRQHETVALAQPEENLDSNAILFLSGLQRTTSPLGAGAALVFFLWGVVR